MTPLVAQPVGSPAARPFLKWAGGKRQLLPELRKHVPSSFRKYVEPFVGGGAFFFDLQPREAILGDVNSALISAYMGVRNLVEGVIRHLERHARLHSKEHYLETRKLLVVNGQPVGEVSNAAARTIYVNKTCFNGLWRVNSKGGFNVPMGDYANPTICDAPGLRAASRALQHTTLLCQDWRKTARLVERGDFVYFDPPYAPVSKTANFVGYASGGFLWIDQVKLMECALQLKAGGAYVLLTNADVPEVRDLYKRGFEMRRVDANRAINSAGGKRGAVGELIIW